MASHSSSSSFSFVVGLSLRLSSLKELKFLYTTFFDYFEF